MQDAIMKIMKALYNLCDEDNYNVYDAVDIAEYTKMSENDVDLILKLLHEMGLTSECMTYHDDGIQTYALTPRAIDMVELQNYEALTLLLADIETALQ